MLVHVVKVAAGGAMGATAGKEIMDRRYYLCSVWGDQGPARFIVNEEAQTIGRSDRVHIVLREPTISRQHATIEVREGTVMLRDLGSKHGTFVNSRRKKEAVLKPGDLIVFGLVVVLRLEQVDEKHVLPTTSLPDPEAREEESTTTLIERLDRPGLLRAGAGTSASSAPRSGKQDLSGIGALCLDLLPGTYARLTKMLNTMADLSEQQVEHVDLEAYRSYLMPVLATLSRLMEVASEMSVIRLEAVAARDVVDRAVARVERVLSRRQITAQNEVSPLLMVQVDPERLVTAIAGLLLNAGQSGLDGALIEIRGSDGGETCTVEIIDEGLGYEDEVLFQAFHLADDNLPPVAARFWEARRVVLSVGGRLSVSTRESRGTVVRIELPAAD